MKSPPLSSSLSVSLQKRLPLKRNTSTKLQSLKRSYARRGCSIHRTIPRVWTPPKPSLTIAVSSEDEDDALSDSSSTSSTLSSRYTPPRKRRRCTGVPKFVHFAHAPQIKEIPSHRCFSTQEKAEIWNSPSVLKKEARRNRKEWCWEGGSIDRVAEETAFKRDAKGRLCHPVHFETKR